MVLVVLKEALFVDGLHAPAYVILVRRVVGREVFFADHVWVVAPKVKTLNR